MVQMMSAARTAAERSKLEEEVPSEKEAMPRVMEREGKEVERDSTSAEARGVDLRAMTVTLLRVG
jgi:hypothetical protein